MWRLDRGEETDCSQAVCQYLMHEVLQLIQLSKNKLRVKSTYGRTKNVVHFKFKILPEYCNYHRATAYFGKAQTKKNNASNTSTPCQLNQHVKRSRHFLKKVSDYLQ